MELIKDYAIRSARHSLYPWFDSNNVDVLQNNDLERACMREITKPSSLALVRTTPHFREVRSTPSLDSL